MKQKKQGVPLVDRYLMLKYKESLIMGLKSLGNRDAMVCEWFNDGVGPKKQMRDEIILDEAALVKVVADELKKKGCYTINPYLLKKVIKSISNKLINNYNIYDIYNEKGPFIEEIKIRDKKLYRVIF